MNSNELANSLSRASSYSSLTSLNMPSCRYCLSSKNIGSLICPCKCIGSLKYVHKSCIIERFKSSVGTETRGSEIFYNCEICKEKISFNRVYRNGLGYSLMYTFRDLITSYYNLMILMVHIVLIYYSINKLVFLFYHSIKLVSNQFKMKSLISYSNEIGLLLGMGYFSKEFVNYYTSLLFDNMKEEFMLLDNARGSHESTKALGMVEHEFESKTFE